MTPAQYAADLERGTDELRAFTLARLESLSRVTVHRLTGDTTTDANGYEVDEWEAVHTDLPFRLVPKGQRAVAIGGVEFSEATARGDMPWDTTDLADEDHIEITAGEWAGTVVKILEAVKGDQRTARRVPVVEVDRPAEWS